MTFQTKEIQMETTAFTKPVETLADDVKNSATVENAKQTADEIRAHTEELIARSSNAVRQGTTRTREALSKTTDQAAHYVQDQPLKSLLMAAAAGAAIALLAAALSNRHSHH